LQASRHRRETPTMEGEDEEDEDQPDEPAVVREPDEN
jgi:hypothetical protein